MTPILNFHNVLPANLDIYINYANSQLWEF